MRSPCIRVCRIREGVCLGCLRTLDEIRNWQRYSDSERDLIMDDVLPRRDTVNESALSPTELMYNPDQSPKN
jgi:predicted Fe-S protein YdhL (DUF1289 family)